jgi:hypothetical protein
MTPGQQSAEIALVSPDDVEAAEADARDLGLVDLGLDGISLAMAVKATRLSRALRCEPYEAWLILTREREGLMKYVHQVQPQAKDRAGAPAATVYVVPEGSVADVAAGALPGDDEDPDFTELFDAEPVDEPGDLSRLGSHDR